MSRTALAAINSTSETTSPTAARKSQAMPSDYHEARGIEDLLLDSLADRVAARILERLGETQCASKRLLTTEQAAEYLGRSKESVQHLVSSGKLPTVRSDRRVFLDVRDLDEWIEVNKVRGI
jgi:excisionase family DNA binding protein